MSDTAIKACTIAFDVIVVVVCLLAAAFVVGRALGARSGDYPIVRRRRRSNVALTAGPYSNPRKVRG